MNGFALNNISDSYVGNTPASAIYLGDTLIWSRQTPTYTYTDNGVTYELLIPDESSGSPMAKGSYTVENDTVTASPNPMINATDINFKATYRGVTINGIADLIQRVTNLLTNN